LDAFVNDSTRQGVTDDSGWEMDTTCDADGGNLVELGGRLAGGERERERGSGGEREGGGGPGESGEGVAGGERQRGAEGKIERGAGDQGESGEGVGGGYGGGGGVEVGGGIVHSGDLLIFNSAEEAAYIDIDEEQGPEGHDVVGMEEDAKDRMAWRLTSERDESKLEACGDAQIEEREVAGLDSRFRDIKTYKKVFVERLSELHEQFAGDTPARAVV
jgi:hypothetical protein